MTRKEILLRAYRHMCAARHMAATYEANRSACKYVHSTSRGHEAIQLALAFQLDPADYVSPYYRDESLLLGLGFSPYQLMLQLLAKGTDPFTAGREYYSHPNYRGPEFPTIIHQSSATGMQAIPTTGIAQGLRYFEDHAPNQLRLTKNVEKPVVVCSLGDASITEGEVAEALQMAVLKNLPILYLVQDNQWGISVKAAESRKMNAYEFAAGFPSLERVRVDGTDFEASYECIQEILATIRTERRPFLLQADVPLLGHHTSGVRKEFYRSVEDLAKHAAEDPIPKLKRLLEEREIPAEQLEAIDNEMALEVAHAFQSALAAADPEPASVIEHVFAPGPLIRETGKRIGERKEKIMMVDAALYAVKEIMEAHPDAVLYGQDVGRTLGGVFREAATLADHFGDHRVFNSAIQEAYIIGSTVGLAAVGLKPIVEIQFGDYIYPGFNQLVTEISKSCYLSAGKFPIQVLIRIPVGAYGGGGPYHSGSIETTLLSIKGIKIVYPSNAADMKGLMKAAFLDPNPVIMLEHKGLYWSKVPGTETARTIEPDAEYIIPLGKAAIVSYAANAAVSNGRSCVVISYGMGVHWAKAAAMTLDNQVEIIDLRCLYPLDEALVFERVSLHGKCLVITEEQQTNSFAEALAARISRNCFRHLDAPVEVIGALDLPAVPMNQGLENAMLPSAEKVKAALMTLLSA